MPSLSNLQLPGMGPLGLPQHLAGPVNPYNNFDGASRSTSAYSTVSASAGPLLNNYTHAPVPQQQQIGGSQNAGRDNRVQFRLPSDQLAQIITALKSDKHELPAQEAAMSMPPPPLPGHANNSKTESTLAHYAPAPSRNQRSELDQNAIDAIDGRAASNSGYSDISMHATCNNFPNCITEDPNGCLVHDNTAAPAAVVKGKKEGSSPTKRKSSSSSATKASDRAEKRARNSTGLLQRNPRRRSSRPQSKSSSIAADDSDAEGDDDDDYQPNEGGSRSRVGAGFE